MRFRCPRPQLPAGLPAQLVKNAKLYHLLALFFLVACTPPPRAYAQFLGAVGLQTVEVPKVLNAVTAATTTPLTCTGVVSVPGGTACIQNLGQTIHILNYTVTGTPTLIQIRLEGSWDGATFVPISDDATDLTNGEVVGLGFYPAVRANLVQCVGCGGVTVTANYSGHFAGPSNLYGFYNPSQQYRKVVFTNVPANANQQIKGIVLPFGTQNGVLIVNGNFPNGSSIQYTAHIGESNTTYPAFTLLGGTGTPQAFPMPPTASTSIDVNYTSGGASANSFSAYVIVTVPGNWPASAQPANALNSQTTATNATASVTIQPSTYQNTYVYSVSARCSAGTAGLTINGGGTIIWTSGATEVGTTTFRYQWNPGLEVISTLSTVISLSTCGAANVGTLDVQASTY
jgi:hypothetical protein